MLGRTGYGRRLARAEDRFVGPERHFLDLWLGVGLPCLFQPVVRGCVVHRSTPGRIRNQWVAHDAQPPEAAPELTTCRKSLPSLFTAAG
jgi:hypothetical protein